MRLSARQRTRKGNWPKRPYRILGSWCATLTCCILLLQLEQCKDLLTQWNCNVCRYMTPTHIYTEAFLLVSLWKIDVLQPLGLGRFETAFQVLWVIELVWWKRLVTVALSHSIHCEVIASTDCRKHGLFTLVQLVFRCISFVQPHSTAINPTNSPTPQSNIFGTKVRQY